MRIIILTLLCLGGTFSVCAQTNFAVSSRISAKEFSKKKISISEESKNISFKLNGGLIMVDSKIDGVESTCIFDTGAPSIIINKDDKKIFHPDAIGVGVNGRMNVKSRIVKDFSIGNIKKKNIMGMEIDISHIEQLKKQSINGILGVGAYKEDEVLVNYKKSVIQFLPRKHKKHFENKTIINQVPFYLKDQLPVIKVKIGKKTFYFGVDTGAEMNVINTKSLKKLKKCKIREGGAKSIAGVNAGKCSVKSITIDQLKIKKQKTENQEFVILDLSSFNRTNGFKIDGILGYPFLKEHLISFDFRRSKLNFWKENYFKIKSEDEKIVLWDKP